MVTLFGSYIDCESQTVTNGTYTFRVATVSLNEPQKMALPSLDDYFRHRLPTEEGNSQENAAWLRGRIEHLFAVKQNQSDQEVDSTIDGKRYRDRLFLSFGFIGVTQNQGLSIAIPFLCSDFYGYTDLRTGYIPDRNGDRNNALVNSMITAFWEIAFQEIDDVPDYSDSATIFGNSYRFGIVGGRPYSEFPMTAAPR